MSDSPRTTGALADALRGSVAVLRALLWCGVAAYLGSGFYVVRQNELAVELRLGAVVGQGDARINRPGLHVAWPAPIGQIQRVDVGAPRVVRSETFWYALSDEERATGRANAPGPGLKPGIDGYLVTADRNLLHARWEVTYQVSDPSAYLFAGAEPEVFIEQALSAAAGRAVIALRVDEALRDQAGLRERVRTELTSRLPDGLGLRVQQVRLLELIPPRQTSQAFEQAARAADQRRQAVDEARSEAATRQQAAAAEAARIVAEARAEKETYVARTRARAEQLAKLLPEYQANPEVLRHRKWVEAIRAALADVELVIVPPAGTTDIQVSRQPQVPLPDSGR